MRYSQSNHHGETNIAEHCLARADVNGSQEIKLTHKHISVKTGLCSGAVLAGALFLSPALGLAAETSSGTGERSARPRPSCPPRGPCLGGPPSDGRARREFRRLEPRRRDGDRDGHQWRELAAGWHRVLLRPAARRPSRGGRFHVPPGRSHRRPSLPAVRHPGPGHRSCHGAAGRGHDHYLWAPTAG